MSGGRISPETILADAKALGVDLFWDGNRITTEGSLPDDWMEICRPWVPHIAELTKILPFRAPANSHVKPDARTLIAQTLQRKKEPCRFLGVMINPKPRCGCGPQHKCAIHGECVTGGTDAYLKICSICESYQKDSTMDPEELAFHRATRNHATTDEASQFRQKFDEAIKRIPPPPQWEADRGIVICAGGWRYLPGAYVAVKLLRMLGCKLPVQIWYMGPGEFDERMLWAFSGLDVGWIDGQSFYRDRLRFMFPEMPELNHGWPLKAFAAAYAPFRQVISLDADCYAVRPLETLFDSPEFQEHGAAFWPDRWPLEPGQWERFGLEPRVEHSWESGQFAVDKGRHWAPLWLACWLNANHEYTYKHIYGDKDSFHIAWRKLNASVWIQKEDVRFDGCHIPGSGQDWTGIAFIQNAPDGDWLFIHRCRDKFRMIGEIDGAGIPSHYMTSQNTAKNAFVSHFPLEGEAHRYLEEFDKLVRPYLHFEGVEPDGWSRAEWDNANLKDCYRLRNFSIKGKKVADVGANMGAFALAAIRHGASEVFAFEPNPEMLPTLERNVLGAPVWVFPVGLWDGPGEDTIQGPGNTKASTGFLRPVGDPGNTAQASLFPQTDGPLIEVQLQSAKKLETLGIDLLKMDCEGAEWPILSVLDVAKFPVILGEWHAVPWNNKTWSKSDLYDLLPGFTLEFEDYGPQHGLFWAARI